MFVIKRDGTQEPFIFDKIVSAVDKAGGAGRAVASEIRDNLLDSSTSGITVDALHAAVIDTIENETAKQNYTLYKSQRDEAREYTTVGKSALSEYITHSKYAHPNETWDDVCVRVMQMHSDKFDFDNNFGLLERAGRALDNMLRKRVLPSMRSLQFGGKGIEANNARLYNCSYSLCDREDFFAELFYLLLSGCGVGYSVSKLHVKKLQPISINPENVFTLEVEDTIEGWADAIKVLFEHSVCGSWAEFDYRKIRVVGSPLKTTNGKAPGHIPLKRTLENVREVLLSANGRQLTPFECHRVCCFIAEGVLSGGIRRSSLIALFDKDDTMMHNCKRGDWFKTHPELRMANNSMRINAMSSLTYAEWSSLIESVREYGEPGYFKYWTEEDGTNPCGEIGLQPISDNGETGFAFCNLSEVNVAICKSPVELGIGVSDAAFLGTLQAAYTDFPYLSQASRDVAERDALLGVSLTGIQDCQFELSDSLLHSMAGVAIFENAKWSGELGINSAARVTTVKPSGTAALLLGCSPGIHPNHAKWYLRRVTAKANEEVFQEFHKLNPHMCEMKPDGDWVVTFPIHSSGKTRSDFSAKEFIDEIERFYNSWIFPGTNVYSGGLTHNVSATVTVKDDEWETVVKTLSRGTNAQAMSFLSDMGDTIYPFAPMEEVRTVTDMARWITLAKWYKEPNYLGGFEDAGSACEGPKCEI
jgi:ribonucleoside-triphosphate reductase